MPEQNDISQLTNLHNNRNTLEHLASQLDCHLKWGESPCNIIGWCACRDSRLFARVVQYVQQVLKIPDKFRRDFEIFPETFGFGLLEIEINKLQMSPEIPAESSLLVTASNFGRYATFNAHGADQLLTDNYKDTHKSQYPKKIILIRHIGECPEERYNFLARIARESQFSKFFWQF